MISGSFEKKIALKTFKNNSGNLSVIESLEDIPFEIKRVFYIYDVPLGAKRGFHAHKTTKQLLICLQGECDVYLEKKNKSKTIKLMKDSEGVLIENEWHIMRNFSSDCILLVLASSHFDENDYIRSYDEFLSFVND